MKGIRLLDKMSIQQLQTDRVSYGATMSTCEQSLMWQTTLVLLCRLLKQELQLDEVVCSIAIRACGSIRRWTQALQFLRLLVATRRQPDPECYNAMITSFERSCE
eukprot:gnl/MRDRNA2_/MRDRNA2_197525_c0_seq1.p1 gnl/MRDRNA2_/MRDRNA2_197525_c0~~gnl/MRDRNA2_/MRDRNA2_197525_c0_seq1.p1  ORF type:complete len:105 (+),score=10.62 gnl/MRDRNA2_/MRDRNA2_197525_c0_seq1:475-789(+)